MENFETIKREPNGNLHLTSTITKTEPSPNPKKHFTSLDGLINRLRWQKKESVNIKAINKNYPKQKSK